MFWMPPPDCGDALTRGAALAATSNCDSNCGGDSTEICGGNDCLSLYWNGQPPSKPTLVLGVPSDLSWELLGCYKASVHDCRAAL